VVFGLDTDSTYWPDLAWPKDSQSRLKGERRCVLDCLCSVTSSLQCRTEIRSRYIYNSLIYDGLMCILNSIQVGKRTLGKGEYN
jgi:hypothetical protein